MFVSEVRQNTLLILSFIPLAACLCIHHTALRMNVTAFTGLQTSDHLNNLSFVNEYNMSLLLAPGVGSMMAKRC